MKTYKLYILDLDGTVYRGSHPTPGAADSLTQLRSRGALIRFLTNNSSRTAADYVGTLKSMGIEALPEEVYSSAIGTAAYLRTERVKSAFVVGENGLVSALSEAGVRVVNRADDGGVKATAAAQAEAVVVGICKRFTYDLLNGAMQQVLAGARFVATNADATYPLEEGRLIPGAGSLVAAVRTCVGTEPTVIGKPNPYLVELILSDAGVSASDALVVGDRVDTDLDAGRAAGCDVHLVLCGITREPVPGVPYSDDLRGLLD